MGENIPATATILTYNSAQTVEKTLASVKEFDEVLVLDGGSTDETLEIAKRYGARIETQSDVPGRISNFTAVRERSFLLAKHDWIFWIDSDEWVDDMLDASLRAAVGRNDTQKAFAVSRVPLIHGKAMRYGPLLPDWVVRLVHRSVAHWASNKHVHEHVVLDPGVSVERLEGALYTPWGTPEEYERKDRYYLSLAFGRPVTVRPSLKKTLYSVIKNALLLCRLFVLWCYYYARYGATGVVMPWQYQRRFLRYYFAIIRERIRLYRQGISYVPPTSS
ncbi:MAG: glycosyltransferase family 2 protein [Patescibacteria group bacterium]